ncbi:NAD(P)/FAD-dependent oxidoreductase [Halobium salinum]|uniref:NAD(P)/FAD-dependent oxidoreductase n=1 Tax=Halobium salinum TaxID=1364940 RepID=A0ABD5PAA6_9EURY|nr:NAD(P)/FAD-dependent oxidoreductase [Halobium salinum]
MDPEYDFVVAGAGPAGLQFAREVVSNSDRSVAVLERNAALSDNDKSTGGTFPEVVEGYGVPDNVVMAEAGSVTFESPNNGCRHPMDTYVLDFPHFLEFLGEDAASDGADVLTGHRVTGPVVENGTVRGVRYRTADGEDGTLRARITVDATGPAATLSDPLGYFDTGTAHRGIGLEIEAEGRYDTDDTLLFSFDHADAPGGYAWTFPAGEEVFKAGVCWVDEFRAARPDGRTITDYVERWVETDPRWKVETVRARHAGEAVWNDSMNRRAGDGFLAVGDAASSINPLFGEGIRPGMESARMAAEVALSALRAGEVSRPWLLPYERRWNDRRGRAWKLQRVVSELLYDFDDAQQDAFVERVAALPPGKAERLRTYELDTLSLARLYPFRPKDLPKLPTILRHLRGSRPT